MASAAMPWSLPTPWWTFHIMTRSRTPDVDGAGAQTESDAGAEQTGADDQNRTREMGGL